MRWKLNILTGYRDLGVNRPIDYDKIEPLTRISILLAYRQDFTSQIIRIWIRGERNEVHLWANLIQSRCYGPFRDEFDRAANAEQIFFKFEVLLLRPPWVSIYQLHRRPWTPTLTVIVSRLHQKKMIKLGTIGYPIRFLVNPCLIRTKSFRLRKKLWHTITRHMGLIWIKYVHVYVSVLQ